MSNTFKRGALLAALALLPVLASTPASARHMMKGKMMHHKMMRGMMMSHGKMMNKMMMGMSSTDKRAMMGMSMREKRAMMNMMKMHGKM